MGITYTVEEEWLIEMGFLAQVAASNYFGLLTAVVVPTARSIMNDPQFCSCFWYDHWPVDADLLVLLRSDGPSWLCHLGHSTICRESPFSTITHTN